MVAGSRHRTAPRGTEQTSCGASSYAPGHSLQQEQPIVAVEFSGGTSQEDHVQQEEQGDGINAVSSLHQLFDPNKFG